MVSEAALFILGHMFEDAFYICDLCLMVAKQRYEWRRRLWACAQVKLRQMNILLQLLTTTSLLNSLVML